MTALYFSPPACLEHDTGDASRARGAHRAIEARLEAGGFLGYERRTAPPATAAQLVRRPRRRRTSSGCARGRRAGRGHGRRARLLRGRGGRRRRGLRDGRGAAGGRSAAWASARCGRPATTPARHTSGFCLFNNVAIAARHALDALGVAARAHPRLGRAPRRRHARHLPREPTRCCSPASTRRGIFPGTGPLHDVGARAGRGFSINLPVPEHSDEATWVSLVEHIVVPAAEEFRPDLILISAGYDAHARRPAGRLPARGRLLRRDGAPRAGAGRAHRRAGRRGAGGRLRARRRSPASVAATMEALAGDEPPDSIAPDHVTARAASHIGHHWTL